MTNLKCLVDLIHGNNDCTTFAWPRHLLRSVHVFPAVECGVAVGEVLPAEHFEHGRQNLLRHVRFDGDVVVVRLQQAADFKRQMIGFQLDFSSQFT